MKFLTSRSEQIIEYSFLLLVFFTPLIFYWKTYELFEFNKMMFVYLMTIIITTFWLVRMIQEKKWLLTPTPLDIPIALFFLANILSTIFSIDLHTSIFGYYSRLNGGLLSTTCYLLLYYSFMATFPREKVKHLLGAIIFGGVLVALWAIPEHFGIDPSCKILVDSWKADCWVQDVKARVFATLGQPNWLAAYLGMIIPVSFSFLLLEKKRIIKLTYLLATTLTFLAFIFTFSRGGTLGLGIGAILFISLLFLSKKKISLPNLGSNLGFIIFITVITIIIALVFGTAFTKPVNLFSSHPSNSSGPSNPPSTPSGTQLDSGGTESGQIRLIVWKGALDIWKHYPILGSGVETFAYSYYQFRPQAHNLTTEWDFLYNKAHNEYLNYLATTGALGLLTYLLFIAVFYLYTFYKLWASAPYYRFVIIGLLAGVTTYLVQNFFSFSVVVIALYFYLFPAITFKLLGDKEPSGLSLRGLEALAEWPKQSLAILKTSLPRSLRSLAMTNNGLSTSLLTSATLLTGLILVYLLGRMYMADLKFSDGYKSESDTDPEPSRFLLQEAVNLNPLEPFYQSELGQVYAISSTTSLNESEREKFATQAQYWGQKAVAVSPDSLGYYRTLLTIYIELLDNDPSLASQALSTARKAVSLAPTEPKVLYNLAALESRLGQDWAAAQDAKHVTLLKADYREAYLLWASSLDANKQRDEAIKVYKVVRKLFPQETEAKVHLKEWTGSED